ncbi:hypothetical protein AAG906_034273 [Vitis piasezkii]
MMFEEMLQLRQGSLSVDQSTDRFHELTSRSKIMETEQQTLARYRTELHNELHKEMWTARLINERVTTPSFQKPSLLKDQSKGIASGDQKGKAKHNGRALNVIIDNGSGMNVISEMAIERLGLKTENHPTPYRIS